MSILTEISTNLQQGKAKIVKQLVQQADAAGIRDKVKIMVGGAPVTQAFCDQIGADKYTSDAASAADAAVQMLS